MKIIKNFLKYTIKFALIGLAISGIMSLGLIGSHGTYKNSSSSCERCSNDWGDSCKDCFTGCFGSIFGALYGCLGGCIECKGSGCIGGFFHGLWHGCDECDGGPDGLRGCVESCKECGEGYKECGQGVANDCGTAAEEFKKDEKDKKRAKNFLIYITSICAAIGAVFGLSIGIQATRRDILAKEAQRKEEEEKARQAAERKRRQEEKAAAEARLMEEKKRLEEEAARLAEEEETKKRQAKEDEKWAKDFGIDD